MRTQDNIPICIFIGNSDLFKKLFHVICFSAKRFVIIVLQQNVRLCCTKKSIALIDIPYIEISSYSPKYILVGTKIHLTCQGVTPISIDNIQMMELVKDGTTFHKWPRMWRVPYTTFFTARQNDTGKYQCKATIGAASRFSPPFSLIVGRK